MSDPIGMIAAVVTAAAAAGITRWADVRSFDRRIADAKSASERRSREELEAWRRVARGEESAWRRRHAVALRVLGGSMTPAELAALTEPTTQPEPVTPRALDARSLATLAERLRGQARIDDALIADAQGLPLTRGGALARRLAPLSARAARLADAGLELSSIGLRTESALHVELRPLSAGGASTGGGATRKGAWLVVACRGGPPSSAAIDAAVALAESMSGASAEGGEPARLPRLGLTRGRRASSGDSLAEGALSDLAATLGAQATALIGAGAPAVHLQDGPTVAELTPRLSLLEAFVARASDTLGEPIDRCVLRASDALLGRYALGPGPSGASTDEDERRAAADALVVLGPREPSDADVVRTRGWLRRTARPVRTERTERAERAASGAPS